ncbi:MAG: hypothetical protein QMB75_00250 [Thauera sp.]
MTTVTTPASTAALRSTATHSAAPQHDTLAAGDRVESLHARRPGRVVWVYPDGSACICWDDGEPQEAGLGHERMPRELLIKLNPAATAPEAVPDDGAEVAPDPSWLPAPSAPLARPLPARDAAAMADLETYCEALFTLLHQHADDDAIEDLCDHFEVMLDTLSARRPQSAMARRWKTLFERHYYPEGGV